jgi:hypothetical protein
MSGNDDLDVALGEQYYGGSKEAEERWTGEIIQVIEKFIDARFRSGRGAALRDAHAKDNGCVSAEFVVDPNLDPELRHGVFQPGRRYKAWIRFSNADSEPGSDRKPDGRGMAIKLTGVEGPKLLPESERNTQDFIMINNPRFFVDHLPRYRNTLEKFLDAQNFFAKLLCVRELRGRERWLALRSSLKLIPNPLLTQYWSTTPYRLGPKLAIKFTAKPRLPPEYAGINRWSGFFRAGFTLKQELESFLKNRTAQFDFYIQRYVDKRTTPIEDSKVEWTEAAAKPEHVATITISAGQVGSYERDVFCENLSFSPWHCLADHKPLGAVNRVRKAVYVAISTRRRELNGAAPSEPTGSESFPRWPERFAGGSAAAERDLFARYARDIQEMQLAAKDRSGARAVDRAFYAQTILAVPDAVLKILPGIDPRFEAGYFRGNAEYRNVIVRLSTNGGGCARAGGSLGMALRVTDSHGKCHDLLLANAPAGPARDAHQFIALAKAMSGSSLLSVPRLVLAVGLPEALRMLRLRRTRARLPAVESVTRETYWSGGAVLWGAAGPVRYFLRPAADVPVSPKAARPGATQLRHELAERLSKGAMSFDFFVQPYVNEDLTPIEDGSVAWSETASPSVHLATLIIAAPNFDSPEAWASERRIDQLALNPWHTTTVFRPLGNVNRARKVVYEASSDHRLGHQFRERIPVRNVIAQTFLSAAFKVLNRRVPWHRLGWRVALLNLTMLRQELRARNLIDPTKRAAVPELAQPRPKIPEHCRTFRTHDGTHNDLSDRLMGSLRMPFGRTMGPVYSPKRFHAPDPIAVSRALLARKRFIPARSLNLLAASWIQFQVHDWVNHDRHPLGADGGAHDVVVPLPAGEKWQSRAGDPAAAEMRIAGNKRLDYTYGGCPVFANQTTPWWDGSEVYGDDEDAARKLRAGAFIRLMDGRYLPRDIQGNDVTGFNESWWLGLSMMHTLFAREHNVLCDALQREYPAWGPERVYQTARLIVSALIAKIHTVEWTPAILAAKAIEIGLPANWYGAPKDWLTQLGIWLVDAHALKGIPQTLPNHHGVPYSLTEEFAAVYRLHPLIPDDYQFFDHRDGRALGTFSFDKLQGTRTDDQMRNLLLSNVIYSFSVAHPGAITLHNYPAGLRKFQRSGGNPGTDTELIDLSVVDLVRDRMRGVPRYNDFRAALHKPRVRQWEELTDDPEDVRLLKQLYGNDIDAVDTMVGLFAETPPVGFGFSDTAFRVFILMASRRLQSDRFLTVDYRREVYSPLGLDWIDRNRMTSIILRHCPGLAAALPREASAFAPFRVVGP